MAQFKPLYTPPNPTSDKLSSERKTACHLLLGFAVIKLAVGLFFAGTAIVLALSQPQKEGDKLALSMAAALALLLLTMAPSVFFLQKFIRQHNKPATILAILYCAGFLILSLLLFSLPGVKGPAMLLTGSLATCLYMLIKTLFEKAPAP